MFTTFLRMEQIKSYTIQKNTIGQRKFSLYLGPLDCNILIYVLISSTNSKCVTRVSDINSNFTLQTVCSTIVTDIHKSRYKN